MLKVGSKFYTFDDLSRRLEEFQQIEQVQLWVRDSRTVVAAAKRARRKSLNPALKYAELTYSCVFGGRRPSDQTKTHNQTSAGGCPFKVRLSTSNDGQALVVKEICHDHNHEPGKKLHEEPRRLYKNKNSNRAGGVRKPVRYLVNKQRASGASSVTTCLSPKLRLPHSDPTATSIRLAQSPFHHLQLHNQQQQQQIKLQLEHHLQQQRIRQQQLEEVVQLDSPDHIDTPDHLSSPDLSSTFEHLGNLLTTTEQYSYLPPSPISPSSLSSSGQTGYSSDEEESVEPIVDLDVALEEALGDLDSVSSMDLEDKFSLAPIGARSMTVRQSDSEPSLSAVPLSSSPSTSTNPNHGGDDPCAPPPAKRFRGRPRKQSFTGTSPKPSDSEEESDFIGFSPVKSQLQSQESMKNEIVSDDDIAQANAMAKQLHVFKPGITFVPGAKLEVLDVRDNKWYLCKVVEVDWGELDILVHYERWSVRFDEWLKMDSTRIRPLHRQAKDKAKSFVVGEIVLGFWAPDSKYYYGQITKQSSEEFFEVRFYDGYSKRLRTSQLKKISPTKVPKNVAYLVGPMTPASSSVAVIPPPVEAPPRTRRKSTSAVFDSPPASPAPAVDIPAPVGASEVPVILDASEKKNIFDVKILEEKRKTKRKPDVEELFKAIKKKRKFEEMNEPDSKPPPKAVPPPKLKIKKEPDVEDVPLSKPKLALENTLVSRPKSAAEDIPLSMPKSAVEEDAAISKPKSAVVDILTSKVKSTDAPTLSSSEKMPSFNVNYFEVDIGHGWRKVCSKRTHGAWMGKWDIYFVTADDRKLRTRQELIKYCEENQTSIKSSDLNFSIRSAKLQYDAMMQSKQDQTQEKQDDKIPTEHKSNVKDIVLKEDPDGDEIEDDDDDIDELVDSSDDEDSDESTEIKPKMPLKHVVKRKRETSSSESDVESSPEKDDVPSVKLSQLLTETIQHEPPMQTSAGHSKSSLASLKEDLSPEAVKVPPVKSKPPKMEPVAEGVEPHPEHRHKCPSKTCEKSFRKENLLQMHMKHYHPHLLKRRSLQAPNVADLAYARTVGDHLDVASQSPSSVAFPSIDFILPEKKVDVTRKTRSLSDSKKPLDKKSQGRSSKDLKKTQEDVSDSEGGSELATYVDNLKEAEVSSPTKTEAYTVDPDYSPKAISARRFRRERTVSRSEPTTKRRNRKSESMSEDDPGERKVVKVRGRKRKISTEPKAVVPSPSDVQSEPPDGEEEAADNFEQSDYQDAIIHCGCKSQEEDGLMLQCDVCLTWQHGNCYNIESEHQVPEKYICFLCENPTGQRSSMRFRHHQEWLKEGKLPRFSFSTSEPNLKLESCIRRGHDLSANVLQVSQLIHSLRLKLKISKESDHPKFVMWHKKWENSPDDGMEKEEKVDSKYMAESNFPAPIHDLIDSFNQPVPNLESQAGFNNDLKNPLQSFTNIVHTLPSVSLNLNANENIAVSQLLSMAGSSAVDKITMEEKIFPLKADAVSEPRTPLLPLVSETDSSAVSYRDGTVDRLTTFSTQPALSQEGKNSQEPAKKGTDSVQVDKSKLEKSATMLKQPKGEKEVKDNVDNIKVSESVADDELKSLENIESASPQSIIEGDKGKTEDPPLAEDKETISSKMNEGNKVDIPSVKKVHQKDCKDEVKEENTEKDVERKDTVIKSEELENKSENIAETKGSDDKPEKLENSNATIREPCEEKPLAKRETLELLGNEVLKDSSEEAQNNTKDKELDIKYRISETKISELEKLQQPELKLEDSQAKDEVARIAQKLEKAEAALKVDEGGTQDSLEDAEDFDLALGTLGAGGETSINDNLAEILSSHPELDQLVDVAVSGYTPLVPSSVTSSSVPVMPTAPIIPKNERIEPVNCRLNLLQHVEEIQNKVFKRFDYIEEQLKSLEAEMGLSSEISREEEELLASDEGEERDAVTLHARALVKLILNDIDTVKKMADFTKP